MCQNLIYECGDEVFKGFHQIEQQARKGWCRLPNCRMAGVRDEPREQRKREQEDAKRMFDTQEEIEPGRKRRGPGVFHPPLPEQKAGPRIQEAPATAQQAAQARALAFKLGNTTPLGPLPNSVPALPALREEQEAKPQHSMQMTEPPPAPEFYYPPLTVPVQQSLMERGTEMRQGKMVINRMISQQTVLVESEKSKPQAAKPMAKAAAVRPARKQRPKRVRPPIRLPETDPRALAVVQEPAAAVRTIRKPVQDPRVAQLADRFVNAQKEAQRARHRKVPVVAGKAAHPRNKALTGN
ncbi:hypothetical protein N431DRAFT_449627 [Stipitochalara longipes BDJ]|nr:hypothetical protein N431DRAFT_449627 [Stipitochalara longipes BDJ]